jgi:hypothetical protein
MKMCREKEDVTTIWLRTNDGKGRQGKCGGGRREGGGVGIRKYSNGKGGRFFFKLLNLFHLIRM